MVNIIILVILLFLLLLSIITVIAEATTKRNSKCGRFFREIRIRLRGISRTSFCVTSILLIFWGLIVKDQNFSGIWAAILTLFAMLFLLHPQDVINLKKLRKKAALKKPLLPLAKSRILKEKL